MSPRHERAWSEEYLPGSPGSSITPLTWIAPHPLLNNSICRSGGIDSWRQGWPFHFSINTSRRLSTAYDKLLSGSSDPIKVLRNQQAKLPKRLALVPRGRSLLLVALPYALIQ